MITLKVKILRSIPEKSKGLIGMRHICPVYFTTRWGIHTFGVLSPIDVLILDKGHRVVKLVHRLPPNRIFFWNPKYSRVVELPAGSIANDTILRGTQILLKGKY
jgi:uncharacterized membrane protein (UPF0127 family)